MQLIAARTAQEFNTRKERKGAFWEDRYHATAVQTDEHLLQCMAYIDLNMVRAGIVRHPRDWEVCGYNEIQSPWTRKGVIDFGRLKDYLDVKSVRDLAILQNRRLDDQIESTRRDPVWTESIAVGVESYVRGVKKDLLGRGTNKHAADNGGTWVLNDCDGLNHRFQG